MTVSQYGGGPKAFAACQPLRPPPNRDDDHVSMPTDPGKQKARDRHSPRTCTSNFVHVVRVDVAVVPAKRRADHEIGEVERVNQRHRIGPHTLAVLNRLRATTNMRHAQPKCTPAPKVLLIPHAGQVQTAAARRSHIAAQTCPRAPACSTAQTGPPSGAARPRSRGMTACQWTRAAGRGVGRGVTRNDARARAHCSAQGAEPVPHR